MNFCHYYYCSALLLSSTQCHDKFVVLINGPCLAHRPRKSVFIAILDNTKSYLLLPWPRYVVLKFFVWMTTNNRTNHFIPCVCSTLQASYEWLLHNSLILWPIPAFQNAACQKTFNFLACNINNWKAWLNLLHIHSKNHVQEKLPHKGWSWDPAMYMYIIL